MRIGGLGLGGGELGFKMEDAKIVFSEGINWARPS
jgi:hypothetical protein